jgi:hypothetical protein
MVLVAAAGFVVYANLLWIQVKLWHWRHGSSATIGSYKIPVANEWLCVSCDSRDVMLVRVLGPRDSPDGRS